MARLRMSVSRSGLELTEVRCSCRPGTQGTQSCNYGRRRGLLKANGEDVARILIREGLAHPYCVRQPWPAGRAVLLN
jgi:micrococcal nuclease